MVDVPKSCTDCQLGNLNFYSVGKDNVYCQLNKKRDIPYKKADRERPDWCPIKEIPVRLEELKCPHSMSDYQRKGFSRGWNVCLDEMKGSGEK